MNVDAAASANGQARSGRMEAAQGRPRTVSDSDAFGGAELAFSVLLDAAGLAGMPPDATGTSPQADEASTQDGAATEPGMVLPSDPSARDDLRQRAIDDALAGGAAGTATPTARSAATAGRPVGEDSDKLLHRQVGLPVPTGQDELAEPLAKAGAAAGRAGGLAPASSAEPLAAPDKADAGSSRDFLARLESARAAHEGEAGAGRTVAVTEQAAARPQFTSLFEIGAMAARAGSSWRGPDRVGPREVAGLTPTVHTVGAEGAAPGTTHGASAVYAPGAATPVPAAAVADRLHFWISRGVQSAELQLDAFDGGSVDVRISVKGQEAMVEFRTDQPLARQLLLDAMPQLKDMLDKEGLLLSGGFVSDPGAGGFGAGGREMHRPFGKLPAAPHGGVAPAIVASAGRSQAAPGRTIDLFV